MALRSYGTKFEIHNNKIFVSGSVKNSLKRIKDVQHSLTYAGWIISYNWTNACQEKLNNPSYREEVLRNCFQGILDAGVHLMVLPGGRGAHVELGYAMALNKKIFILADSPDDLKDVLVYNKDSITVVYNIYDLLTSLDRMARWKNPQFITGSLNCANTTQAEDPIPF